MITSSSKSWYAIKGLIPHRFYEPLLDVYHNVRKIRYKGSSVYCPVCDAHFNKFIPSGNIGICPACSSGSRHRAIYLFLKRKTNFFTGKMKVLHFAPEHCFYKSFKAMPNLEYLSADLNSPRAMVKMDINNIPYEDNHFDIVISSHVLEHIPDDMKAMRELYRVASKQGWSIHLAPIDYSRETTLEDPSVNTPELRQDFYGHHDHKRIYGRDYASRLRAAGFLVDVLEPKDYLTGIEMKKYGVDKNEMIYCCTKREMKII
jgi:SAM-dependent methyltransferase